MLFRFWNHVISVTHKILHFQIYRGLGATYPSRLSSVRTGQTIHNLSTMPNVKKGGGSKPVQLFMWTSQRELQLVLPVSMFAKHLWYPLQITTLSLIQNPILLVSSTRNSTSTNGFTINSTHEYRCNARLQLSLFSCHSIHRTARSIKEKPDKSDLMRVVFLASYT